MVWMSVGVCPRRVSRREWCPVSGFFKALFYTRFIYIHFSVSYVLNPVAVFTVAVEKL